MTEPTSDRTPFHRTTPGPVPSPDVPTGVPTNVPEARWDAIVADLEARGVDGEPSLVSAEAVTWPNGALGCPSPGLTYTQAIVDGMRVVVEVDDRSYDYRFGSTDAPQLCEQSFPSSLRSTRGANPHA